MLVIEVQLAASTHFARERRDRSGNRGTFLVWRNDKALLQVARKREHRFLIGTQNQVRRHEIHPGTTQGIPRSENPQNTEDNRQSGERGNDMLLTYLLQQLAPTLAVAFRRDPNP